MKSKMDYGVATASMVRLIKAYDELNEAISEAKRDLLREGYTSTRIQNILDGVHAVKKGER